MRTRNQGHSVFASIFGWLEDIGLDRRISLEQGQSGAKKSGPGNLQKLTSGSKRRSNPTTAGFLSCAEQRLRKKQVRVLQISTGAHVIPGRTE